MVALIYCSALLYVINERVELVEITFGCSTMRTGLVFFGVLRRTQVLS